MLNISAKIQRCSRAAFVQHFISMAAYSQRQSKATEKLLCSVTSVTADLNSPTSPQRLGQGVENTALFHSGPPASLTGWGPAASADRWPNMRRPSARGGRGPQTPGRRSRVDLSFANVAGSLPQSGWRTDCPSCGEGSLCDFRTADAGRAGPPISLKLPGLQRGVGNLTRTDCVAARWPSSLPRSERIKKQRGT